MSEVVEAQIDLSEDHLGKTIEQYLTGKLLRALHALPTEVCTQSVTELEQHFNVTTLLKQLKLSLWNQYRVAHEKNLSHISPSAVYDHLCSRAYFYVDVVDRPHVYAWMLHPPVSYEVATEEALNYGIERVREMLTAPLFSEAGNFIKENAAVILSAVKFLDSRVKGSPLQRIEQKNLSVHMHQHTEGLTKEALDAELLELRRKLETQGAPLAISAPEDTE